MCDRGARRGAGAGAPFYAPPRRKTSAEIISEARAAICAEMNTGSAGGGGGGVLGALRPLRTRRPFTPREPQRTLFTERARKRDTRPPSAFDLKHLSLLESCEDTVADACIPGPGDQVIQEILLAESQNNARKKPGIRNQPRPSIERCGEGWGALPKLPHLSGRSKPLHRRHATHHHTADQAPDGSINANEDLAQAISITRALAADNSDIGSLREHISAKSLSPESDNRRKCFAGTKAMSCDGAGAVGPLGDVTVRHLAVQLPTTLHDNYENMSLLELADELGQRGRVGRVGRVGREESEGHVERTLAQLAALQAALRGAAERGAPAASLRDYVLRALYAHLDSDDERVLVAIARAMLTMRVTGAHLTAACKLVFKIARNDKNDHFFKDTNLLELLVEGFGRAEPVSESECCVYAAGALRFLALEPRLCALAHRAGALHLAALHLKILNNAKAERPRQVSEQATHALYQVTGALRNLAGGAAQRAEFAHSGALAELLAALRLHTDRDVLTNVARCLSVLSAEECCCAWLCAGTGGGPGGGGAGAARVLLRALAACAARAPLAVRLAYTLGNMAAADHHARINIYNEEGGVDVLLTILESYTKRNDTEPKEDDEDPDLHLLGSDLGGSDGSNEDVLIKTVRVVANLCLAEQAGRGLLEHHAERTVKALLACLHVAERIPAKISESPESELGSWFERREELATAALATLNNVSFYLEPSHADPLDETLDNLCRAACRWVRGDAGGGAGGAGGGAAACEAVRALGNLSRAPRAARLIVLEGALQALPLFQRHEEASVRCGAAGVLVNVCGAGAGAGADAGAGAGAADEAAGAAARALVAAAAGRDLPAAALLARALWNALAHRPLPPAHAQHAAAALTSFIDDDSVFEACEASQFDDRRTTDPELSKHHHVTFDIDNNNYPVGRAENYNDVAAIPLAVKAYSVDNELHLEQGSDEDGNATGCSGEDLGFEEGDIEECECEPCKRLAAWEELVAIAIPLLDKLKPPRADASVGTD